MNATTKQAPTLDELLARLDEPCVVVMKNATHRDGRRGDAYIDAELRWGTLDRAQAKVFTRFDAERYADHWRGWYRGFAGGCTIEVRSV